MSSDDKAIGPDSSELPEHLEGLSTSAKPKMPPVCEQTYCATH